MRCLSPRHIGGLCMLALGLAGPVSAQNPSDTSMGAGGAWLDCNGDSILDLMFVTNDGKLRFMIYNPVTERFTQITETAVPPELYVIGKGGMGVACGDFNNDGLEDLFLTSNGPNTLLLNNGDATFTGVSRTAGIKGPKNPVTGLVRDVLTGSAGILDYNQDGLLDIFVANYEGHANQLFRNDGIGGDGVPRFTDVAPALGLDWAKPGQSNWGLGVALADYDNDGDTDIYVANDYNGINIDVGGLNPGGNMLYRNNGNGTFTDVTEASGAGDQGWAMGVTFGDFDQDGWQDIFVANFWEDALLRNNRDGTFTNVTQATGLITGQPGEHFYNSWGTALLDYDNDGDLDLHVANGFIPNDQGQVPNEPDQLWENVGLNGQALPQFIEVGAAAGINSTGDARGTAYADFNQDGFVDYYLMNNNFVSGPGAEFAKPVNLFVNQGNGTFREMGWSFGLRTSNADSNPLPARKNLGENRWLQIRPVNAYGSLAHGARITVTTGSRVQVKDVGASSYLSQNSPFFHFGLGQVSVVDEVRVKYPNGTTVVETNVPVNSLLTVSPNGLLPVELLSFGIQSTGEGVRLEWTWRDDNDASFFNVVRLDGALEQIVARNLAARDGRGSFTDPSAPAGELTYALDVVYRDGARERLKVATVRHTASAPRVTLLQNLPNPFTASTQIPLRTPAPAEYRIEIFDVQGRSVRVLTGSLSHDGNVPWDGRDALGLEAPPGAYFYRLAPTGQVRKMIRLP